MYNKNSNGPSIEPCGIRHIILFGDDVYSLKKHTCFLFVKHDSNYFSSKSWIPN